MWPRSSKAELRDGGKGKPTRASGSRLAAVELHSDDGQRGGNMRGRSMVPPKMAEQGSISAEEEAAHWQATVARGRILL